MDSQPGALRDLSTEMRALCELLRRQQELNVRLRDEALRARAQSQQARKEMRNQIAIEPLLTNT